jgi:hypothetical protein
MLKKLAVPFLVLSLAAFGCSSSSTSPDATGTGGKGGSGGSGGGGGKGGSGGGSGGSTGTGGTTDGSAEHAGDGGDAPNLPACTTTDDAVVSAMDTAQAFCANLLNTCAAFLDANYNTMTKCVSAYNAANGTTSTGTSQKHCQSYHLCGNTIAKGMSAAVHCPHAQGAGPCAAVSDAGGQ